MSKKNSFFKVLILGVIFTITGYFVAFTFGKPILDSAKSSSHWPEAQGIIQKSTVERGRKDGKTMYILSDALIVVTDNDGIRRCMCTGLWGRKPSVCPTWQNPRLSVE